MAKNYTKAMLIGVAVMSATSLMAIDPPTISSQLQDGHSYILFNKAKPSLFWSTTSWDGSYYLLDYASSNWRNAAFTAHQDETGWYFATGDSTYVGYNEGDANLKGNLKQKVHYIITPSTDYEGYYRIVSDTDQVNEPTRNLPLHLNNGGQYVVTTYQGNSWFPDYYNRAFQTVAEDVPDPYIDTETGWIVPTDSTSEYWAFAEVDEVPAYAMRTQLYDAITSMAANYATDSLADYKDGFQGAVDAATAYYNTTPFDSAAYLAGKAIIDNKLALYNEILAAQTLDGAGTDATLSAAISAARQSFGSENTGAALETALNTLRKAEEDYNLGLGDLTSLGQNMSFEDLSAQGGSTTSGTGPTPTGWDAWINGTKVSTADEVRAAGVGGWYGVNADADGDLDGQYAFGIWNSGMPTYQISQTLTGLDNGTYEVTAALMAGGNGNGSRLTSQRIFGNLNSTLFASEADYNSSLFDTDEVLAYAGNGASETTDRTLHNITVNAYVYDGTLTFGLKTDGDIAKANRTTANSAGGDGWFKVDNFRIKKLGYQQADALGVFNHFYDLLSNLSAEKMQVAVEEVCNNLIDNYSSIGESSDEATINEAILALKDSVKNVKNSVEAYTKLDAALLSHYETADQYRTYAGYDDYNAVIEEAQTAFDDAELDEAGIDRMIAALDEALTQCKLSGVNVGGEFTSLIANPSFEDLSAQGGSGSSGTANPPAGWTLTLNGDTITSNPSNYGLNWCAINGGDGINVEVGDEVITKQPTDGENLWGIWASSMPEVELSQTITGMPAGTYLLTADVMVQNNWAGNNISTQRIFANGCVELWGEAGTYNNLPSDVTAAADFDNLGLDTLKHLTFAGYTCESGDRTTDLLKHMAVRFGVQDDGIMHFGFRTNGVDQQGKTYADGAVNGVGWFKVDNFRLYYESLSVPVSGIKTVGGDTSATKTEYYTIGGQKLNAPQKGIIIVKTHNADGSVSVKKLVVK